MLGVLSFLVAAVILILILLGEIAVSYWVVAAVWPGIPLAAVAISFLFVGGAWFAVFAWLKLTKR
jgi:hypothetical protein